MRISIDLLLDENYGLIRSDSMFEVEDDYIGQKIIDHEEK